MNWGIITQEIKPGMDNGITPTTTELTQQR